MLLTERIQLHDCNRNLCPDHMNNDMKGKRGDNLCLTVIQNSVYEPLEEFPRNEDSHDDTRTFQGRIPSPISMQSSTMLLDLFTVKDKEDTISIQGKRSDGDYIPMNSTNPFRKMDGDVLDNEDTIAIQNKKSDCGYTPMNATNPFHKMDGDVIDKEDTTAIQNERSDCGYILTTSNNPFHKMDGDVTDKEVTTSFQSETCDSDYIPMNATNPFQKMDGDVEEIHNEI